jgi:hypothetical protein
MTRTPKTPNDRPPWSLETADESTLDAAPPMPIVARPDGYYWQSPDGKQEFGPFETLEEAQADRDAADEAAPEPGETLQEAESEIGIADWIDPETGEPAEGMSPPRFEPE